ncbi:methyltransferase type 12 [Humibacillus sp. DSM 29435]|uniref:class I SAM-dependent methyltransferase n=1 Tax=Humibacillus sp. DSM 29435 TaxID=1869167 RepID=UPI00087207B5|nr:class I SAM-dependent methyltransferase [Humibacillus sp. DSM 29435]OFE18946.1 methyltransferase type 12 [Humibacillus sp. DSM 29435]
MDAHDWDERYAAHDLVWSAEPNQFVAELVGALSPGSAIDVAAGEGRNAIWMVEQGWTVTAADYSAVAVDRARALGDQRLGDRASSLTTVVADATLALPGGPGAYDLALFSYLQLPASMMREALAAAIEAVRIGGHVIVVGHAGRNLEQGHGGPSDRAVLYDPDEVLTAVADRPVEVESSQIRVRRVETEQGPREALDTVVVLRRV